MLTQKDIHDLKDFACKHSMDFVAASFVQSAADVRFIRSVLDEGGGFDIKIISKIENQEGLNNFAEILRETDGVMIARGVPPPPRRLPWVPGRHCRGVAPVCAPTAAALAHKAPCFTHQHFCGSKQVVPQHRELCGVMA